MIKTMTTMTAQIPSSFGMPTSGHATGSTLGRFVGSADACAIAAPVVRERKAVAGIGTGLVQGYFPGTTAWRPPTC
jgi:hypothetical protein